MKENVQKIFYKVSKKSCPFLDKNSVYIYKWTRILRTYCTSRVYSFIFMYISCLQDTGCAKVVLICAQHEEHLCIQRGTKTCTKSYYFNIKLKGSRKKIFFSGPANRALPMF